MTGGPSFSGFDFLRRFFDFDAEAWNATWHEGGENFIYRDESPFRKIERKRAIKGEMYFF